MDPEEVERRLQQKDKLIEDLDSALRDRANQMDKYMETISELRMQLIDNAGRGSRPEQKDEGIQMTQQRLTSPRREGKENFQPMASSSHASGVGAAADVEMVDQDVQCSPVVRQDVGLQAVVARLSQSQSQHSHGVMCANSSASVAPILVPTVTATAPSPPHPHHNRVSVGAVSSSSSPMERGPSESLIDPPLLEAQGSCIQTQANDCLQRWKTRLREQFDDLEVLITAMEELRTLGQAQAEEFARERAGWESERQDLRGQLEEQREAMEKFSSLIAIHKEVMEQQVSAMDATSAQSPGMAGSGPAAEIALQKSINGDQEEEENGDVAMEPVNEEKAQLEAEVTNLKSRLEVADGQVAELTAQVTALQSQLVTEKNLAAAKEEKLQSLIKCTEQLDCSAKALERRLSQSDESRIAFLETQLSEANNWLSDLERQLEEARTASKDARAKATEYELKCKDLEEKLVAQKSQLDGELETLKRAHNEQLAAQSENYEQQQLQLKGEIASLTETRAELSSELERSHRQLSEFAQKMATDTSKLSALEAELQTARDVARRAEQLNVDLEARTTQLKALESIVQDRDTKIQQQTETVSTAQKELKAALEELTKLRSQGALAQHQVQEKDNLIRELRDTIASRERTIEEAEKRASVAELENLKAATRSADAIRQYDLKVSALQNELTECRAKLREAEMNNRELGHQLEEKKISALSAMLPQIVGASGQPPLNLMKEEAKPVIPHPTPNGSAKPSAAKVEKKPETEPVPLPQQNEPSAKRARDEAIVIMDEVGSGHQPPQFLSSNPSAGATPLTAPIAIKPSATTANNNNAHMQQLLHSATQIPIISLSGFKDSPDPALKAYSLNAKIELHSMIVQLGGQVVLDNKPMASQQKGGTPMVMDRLDEHVTHVISPPTARTIKTLAAALTNRWILGVEWVLDSIKAGYWLDESPYGFHGNAQLLSSKRIFLSHAFQSAAGGPRLAHAKLLVEEYGKGGFTDQLDQADIVFMSTKEDPGGFGDKAVRLTWEQFIEYIYPKTVHTKAVVSDGMTVPEKKPRIS